MSGRFRWFSCASACALLASTLALTVAAPATVARASTALQPVSLLAGSTGTGVATSVAMSPMALAVQGTSLYVVDGGSQQSCATTCIVRKVDLGTGQETVIGGGGYIPAATVAAKSGLATHALLRDVGDLVVRPDGSVWLAAGELYQINPSGVLSVVPGSHDGHSWSGPLAPLPDGTVAAVEAGNSVQGFPGADGVYDVDGSSQPKLIVGSVARLPLDIRPEQYDGALASGFPLDGAGGVGGLGVAETPQGLMVSHAGDSGPITTIVDAAGRVHPFAANNVDSLRSEPSGTVLGISEITRAVVRIASDGTTTVVAGGGHGPVAEGAPAAGSALTARAVTSGPDGTTYVADYSRVWSIDATGKLHEVAGNGSNFIDGGDGGPAVNAQLAFPSGLALASDGSVLVADTNPGLVRRVSSTGSISTVAGDPTGQSPPPTNGAQATKIRLLTNPVAVLAQSSGGFYGGTVTDIFHVDASGVYTEVAGGGSDTSLDYTGSATAAQIAPVGMATDATGALYFADRSRAVIYQLSNGQLTKFAGTPTSFPAGACSASTSGNASSANFCQINALAATSGNTLYLSYANGIIATINILTKQLTEIASAFPAGDSHQAVGGLGGEADVLAVGPTGAVYAALTPFGGITQSAVRRIDTNGSITTVIGDAAYGCVGGTQEDGGAGATAADACDASVTGLAVDPTGRLYISDAARHRVLSIDHADLASVPPGPPTSVSATPGDGTADVSWTAPDADGGQNVTSYTVTASPGGGTTTVSGSSTTGHVTGLSNGTDYTFTVTATTSAGTGDPSDPSNPVTPATGSTPCRAPTIVEAVGETDAVLLDWTSPPACGSGPITGYRIVAQPGNHQVDVPAGQGGGEGSVDGLQDGATYAVTVASMNAAGVGPASQPAQATPLDPPAAPTNVRVIPRTNSFTVVWDAPTPDVFLPTLNYFVQDEYPLSDAPTIPADSSVIDVPSTPRSYHQFRLAATNAAGPSAATPLTGGLYGQNVQASAPGSPTAVTATALAGGVVDVTWQPPTSDGGSPISDYIVASQPQRRVVVTDGATTTAAVTGLIAGQTYTFVVWAGNAAARGQTSAPSNPVIAPAAAGAPGTPTAPQAQAGDSRVHLTWQPPTTPTDAPITGYDVYRGIAADSTPQLLVAGLTTATYDDVNVVNGTTYNYSVVAHNKNGDSPRSQATSATPTANAPPIDTQAPVARVLRPTSAWTLASAAVASWTASDPSGIARYDVRSRVTSLTGTTSAWTMLISGTTSTSTRLALSAGTTRCVDVRATDGVGNVGPWSSARCTTRPLDDRSLRASSSWTRVTGSSYFNRTATVTTVHGRTLTGPRITTTSVTLVVLTCSSCGAVDVYVGTTHVARVSLVTTSTIRQHLIHLALSRVTTGVVSLRVATSGRRVVIDGLQP